MGPVWVGPAEVLVDVDVVVVVCRVVVEVVEVGEVVADPGRHWWYPLGRLELKKHRIK